MQSFYFCCLFVLNLKLKYWCRNFNPITCSSTWNCIQHLHWFWDLDKSYWQPGQGTGPTTSPLLTPLEQNIIYSVNFAKNLKFSSISWWCIVWINNKISGQCLFLVWWAPLLMLQNIVFLPQNGHANFHKKTKMKKYKLTDDIRNNLLKFQLNFQLVETVLDTSQYPSKVQPAAPARRDNENPQFCLCSGQGDSVRQFCPIFRLVDLNQLISPILPHNAALPVISSL